MEIIAPTGVRAAHLSQLRGVVARDAPKQTEDLDEIGRRNARLLQRENLPVL